MDQNLLYRFFTQQASDDEVKIILSWIEESAENREQFFKWEKAWSVSNELRFGSFSELNRSYLRWENRIKEENELVINGNSFDIEWKAFARYVAVAALVFSVALNIAFMVKKEKRAIGENVIEVPNGQSAMLTLSDGTKVWLNADSRLVYPTMFSDDEREVVLDGEGYFDVAHNENIPFVVQTANVSIKVLGTQFNAYAYDGEEAEVTLVEGRVKLISADERTEMYPNESVTYCETAGFKKRSRVDAILCKSWIDGDLVFVDESLGKIINSLERKFDIDMQVSNCLSMSDRYTCRTESGASLSDILYLLKTTGGIDYLNEDGKIVLYRP